MSNVQPCKNPSPFLKEDRNVVTAAVLVLMLISVIAMCLGVYGANRQAKALEKIFSSCAEANGRINPRTMECEK